LGLGFWAKGQCGRKRSAYNETNGLPAKKIKTNYYIFSIKPADMMAGFFVDFGRYDNLIDIR
jgi:hypothetical protein